MLPIARIEQHFFNNDLFPSSASLWEEGKAVYESPFIQKVHENKFVVHSQRHYALNPFLLAENAKWEFSTLSDAFQKWQNLEKRIFG
jgi:hypothetical protein